MAQITDVAELPDLCTKKVVAKWMGVCTRQVEILANSGRFPTPIRVGKAPRWRRSALLEWLNSQDCK